MNQNGLTMQERVRCFRLLDGYARSIHDSFLSGVFQLTNGSNYFLCFRPANGSVDDPNHYACKYVQLDENAVLEMAQRAALPSTMQSVLDSVLPTLRTNFRCWEMRIPLPIQLPTRTPDFNILHPS